VASRAAGVGAPAGAMGRVGGADVDQGHGEGEGPGLIHPSLRGGAWTALPRGSVRRSAVRVQPLRVERRVDGRFGRCRGCEQVLIFCGPCASVGAYCAGCAQEPRRQAHRRANQAYARTPKGRASNRARQERWRGRRALNRRHVTDTISTDARPPLTPPSPSSSAMEPARDKEVSTHEASNRAEDRRPACRAGRCARCGRVLSGRVRPSEWTPPRRACRSRAPRPPRARPS
jgi:hypothetical protein